MLDIVNVVLDVALKMDGKETEYFPSRYRILEELRATGARKDGEKDYWKIAVETMEAAGVLVTRACKRTRWIPNRSWEERWYITYNYIMHGVSIKPVRFRPKVRTSRRKQVSPQRAPF